MKPRKFKHRIEIHGVTHTADGFGGNTVDEAVDSLLVSSWCKVVSIPRNKLTEFGLDEVKKAIRVFVRHRNDLDYNRSDLFLKYKGERFAINSVVEKNLDGFHFQIIATT